MTLFWWEPGGGRSGTLNACPNYVLQGATPGLWDMQMLRRWSSGACRFSYLFCCDYLSWLWIVCWHTSNPGNSPAFIIIITCPSFLDRAASLNVLAICSWVYRQFFQHLDPVWHNVSALKLYFETLLSTRPILQGSGLEGEEVNGTGTFSSIVGKLWRIFCAVPWVQECQWSCLRLLQWIPCKGLEYVF